MFRFHENQVIEGKYRLEREVAKGGMGTVWVARNLQLDIPVAVKFMAPEALGSAELVARFEREARAAAQLRSPHVVHIYEHGVVQDTPFMVMELLEGEDLSKRLRSRGRLPLDETVRIVVDVCKALRRAHEQNIVHRDLKPGNVFLCRQDEEEIVKVLDFGIAKILVDGPEVEMTRTGAIVGTPYYMSPEQARCARKDVDHRTDLWALGVIAYRALTGRLPFTGETSIDVIMRVCAENHVIATPSSVAPDLGPEVDRFLARALARPPEKRFQSAREMAEAMSALLPRSPSAAPPPVEAHDPFGLALTVPIACSAAGQALLRGPPSPRHTPPLGPLQSVLLQHPGVGSSPPPGGSGGWPAQPPPPPSAPAPEDGPGTITSAATETSPLWSPRARSSWIIWAASAAVVLVLLLVGWTVTTGLPPESADSPPLIPLPLPPAPEPPAPPAPAPEPPAPTPPAPELPGSSSSAPSVSGTATVAASASASATPATSTSTARAVTPPSGRPKVSPSTSSAPGPTIAGEKNNSGMIGPPVF